LHFYCLPGILGKDRQNKGAKAMNGTERRQAISQHLQIAPQPMRESEQDIEAIQIAIANLIDRGDVAALSQLNVYVAGALGQVILSQPQG
jgi:uncharacterized 2Fe-2S/4Fe-4S cluster protein (DUF4445 family)